MKITKKYCLRKFIISHGKKELKGQEAENFISIPILELITAPFAETRFFAVMENLTVAADGRVFLSQ